MGSVPGQGVGRAHSPHSPQNTAHLASSSHATVINDKSLYHHGNGDRGDRDMGSRDSPAVGSSPGARVPSAALPVWGRASHVLLGQSQPWTPMVGPTVKTLARRNVPHTSRTTVSPLLRCLCPHSPTLPAWHCWMVPAHRPYLMSRGWGCGVPLCPNSILLPSCPHCSRCS